jgi:hypothetical protein
MPSSEKDYWSLLTLHYQQQQERQFLLLLSRLTAPAA